MKKSRIFKWVTCLSLALVLLVSPFIAQKIDNDNNLTLRTTTVEAETSQVDYKSSIDQFEDAYLDFEGTTTTFEGKQTFKMTDLLEIDEVSELNVDNEDEVAIKYNYSYDYETNLVSLTAVIVGEDCEPIIETIYGEAFINDEGNIDALLDLDDEEILLSEIQDGGMIANCGFFKNLFKKVKKVCSTVVGKVGAVLTVAVPALIGVACAATGIGLPVAIGLGIAAGAVIGGATAVASTLQQDGKVDWEAVGYCMGVGAVVGGAASGIAYGVTKAIMKLYQISKERIYQVAYAIGKAPLTITATKLNYIEALSILAVYKTAKAKVFKNQGISLIPRKLFTDSMSALLKTLEKLSISDSKIGVYTPVKTNAAKLAYCLGAARNSKYENHGSGYHNHYHDKEHAIHVWFGAAVK